MNKETTNSERALTRERIITLISERKGLASEIRSAIKNEMQIQQRLLGRMDALARQLKPFKFNAYQESRTWPFEEEWEKRLAYAVMCMAASEIGNIDYNIKSSESDKVKAEYITHKNNVDNLKRALKTLNDGIDGLKANLAAMEQAERRNSSKLTLNDFMT